MSNKNDDDMSKFHEFMEKIKKMSVDDENSEKVYIEPDELQKVFRGYNKFKNWALSIYSSYKNICNKILGVDIREMSDILKKWDDKEDTPLSEVFNQYLHKVIDEEKDEDTIRKTEETVKKEKEFYKYEKKLDNEIAQKQFDNLVEKQKGEN